MVPILRQSPTDIMPDKALKCWYDRIYEPCYYLIDRRLSSVYGEGGGVERESSPDLAEYQ